MNFLLTLYTKESSHRNFTIQGVSLETGLDFVNTIIEQGEQIIAVRCIDQDVCIELPADVFDGESFSKSLSALQQEWEQILAQPILSSHVSETNWVDRLHRVHQAKQTRKVHLQTCRWRIQMLAERAELRLSEGPYKTALLRHYTRLLHHFSDSLAKTAGQ